MLRALASALLAARSPGYGAHCDDYPSDYLTVAAALGTTRADIDTFVLRMRQCFAEFRRKQQQQQGPLQRGRQ